MVPTGGVGDLAVVRRGNAPPVQPGPAQRSAGVPLLCRDRACVDGDRPAGASSAERDRAAVVPGPGGAARRVGGGRRRLVGFRSSAARGAGPVRVLLRTGVLLRGWDGLRRR